jgi:CRP-like cAMP-binding protein
MVSISNLFLQRLTTEDYDAVEPFLERVDLTLKQTLVVPREPIRHVWFPESGIISVLAGENGSESIEVGMIGREGLTDHLTEEGATSVLRTMVQRSGFALAVKASNYLEWLRERPTALQMVLRFQQSMIVQISYTALSHGSYTIEERLARWLLMSFDRSNGEELPLVHEFISQMLAVRRSGVTTALHVLEGQGAIKALRGHIHLRNRQELEDLAHGSYGVAEREYDRLLGPLHSRTGHRS